MVLEWGVCKSQNCTQGLTLLSVLWTHQVDCQF